MAIVSVMRGPGLILSGAILLIFNWCAAAQEGTVPRDGLELHYHAEGSGKAIVFLSGGPGLEDYMTPAAQLFPPGYQHVFLEQRGTGRSRPAKLTSENISLRLMVDDLEALRIGLKLDRLILAGHSWGGITAMAYAASYPNRVDRLILIDSAGPTNDFWESFGDNIEARLHTEDKEARAYWIEAMKQGVDRDKVSLEILKAIAPGYFFDRAKGLAFAAQLPAGFFHVDVSALLHADLEKKYDLREGLRQVLRPVLIIQGHQDPLGDKTAEDIHALVRASTLRYINRCGHFPWIEQPEKMRAILSEFLNSN